MANDGNQTPNTPGLSETELRAMKVDELRELARTEGVEDAGDLHKEDLVKAVSATYRERGRWGDEGAGGDSAGGAPEDSGGGIRHGSDESKSLKYSQEITSPDDDPERPGRSLVTTHHDVIRQWAEDRGATPSTVPGTEHDGHLGVLRFDFPGYGGDSLEHVSWDKWFEAFDARKLNFIYQEERANGSQSNFFRLENPEREDA
ncbi:Rho termination factor N-terminal domain-containing protein [Motilibacter aurantiacus]|uniref:Rho termination factor N-terminal domain-containing protein n=1 Tax=Motilibacter aurantiacus TaxID=2714955 RepID=UPI001409C2D2|nr:Rho termination factor N-terminal domain-containing protein [Motilibacter aurantiacus]NHC45599.1 hypothetical protein [Motilibacter aurantiacus]